MNITSLFRLSIHCNAPRRCLHRRRGLRGRYAAHGPGGVHALDMSWRGRIAPPSLVRRRRPLVRAHLFTGSRARRRRAALAGGQRRRRRQGRAGLRFMHACSVVGRASVWRWPCVGPEVVVPGVAVGCAAERQAEGVASGGSALFLASAHCPSGRRQCRCPGKSVRECAVPRAL